MIHAYLCVTNNLTDLGYHTLEAFISLQLEPGWALCVDTKQMLRHLKQGLDVETRLSRDLSLFFGGIEIDSIKIQRLFYIVCFSVPTSSCS